MPSGSRQGRDPDAGLSPAERVRLVGILGMLGSEHDGERAAAGLLATRLLHAKRLGWDDLIGQAVQPYARPDAAADSWADLALCRRHRDELNGWEADFVRSLAARRDPLTSGQARKLAQTAAKLRARGLA